MPKIEKNSENAKSSAGKVLLIDGDADARGYGRQLLKRKGYEFFEAEDGRAALQIVERNRLDLIVADVMMPGMYGLEFLKILRGKEEMCEMPVILLSAWTGDKARI